MDGQTSTHGSSYAYASPHWPECYDLWINHLFGQQHEDTPVFINAVLSQLPSSPSAPFTILDIGTGTGRIVKDLVSSLREDARLQSAQLHITGTDNSTAMLSRAQRTFSQAFQDLPIGWYVRWCRAPAAEMLTVLSELQGQVDMAVFAAGGIAHLTAERELVGFLRQLGGLLRPVEARAVVSILHEFMRGFSAPGQQSEEQEEKWNEDPMVLPSEENEGLVFVKYPAEERWEGDVRMDRFVLEVRGPKGMVERSEVEWSERVVYEDEFFEAVRKAGLVVERRVRGKIQDWFFLMAKEKAC